MQSSPSNSRIMAWAVWIIASVFYSYQFILRVMPNILLNDIMQQFDIGAGTFGQFSGVYYIGYSLVHIPIGVMLDRYGPRKVMTSCILLSVVGMLPLLFAEHWAYPIVGRLLVGVGSSAAILSVFKIIRMTFSEERFPRMLSLSVAIGLVGAIYGGGPLSYMREVFGYHAVIQLFAVSGLILAIVTYCIVPDAKSTCEGTIASNIKEVFGNRRVIWSCACAGMMVGPMEGFADVWGTVFLKQVYGLDGTLAASMPSMMYIGMCVGGPILSLIADKMGSYLATIIGAGITMSICFSLFLFIPLASSLLTASFFLVGVCCAYQILAIYKASTYVREQVAGLTTAVANMIIMLFGYAFHSVIGGLVTLMGGPTTSQALMYGVAVIPIALCLGTAGFLLLSLGEKSLKESPRVEAA